MTDSQSTHESGTMELLRYFRLRTRTGCGAREGRTDFVTDPDSGSQVRELEVTLCNEVRAD